MDECRVDGQTEGASFEELYAEMQTDMYWIRFFARPCCPAPKLEDAAKMLDRLKGEVLSHANFSDDEKQQLCDEIESRKAWYETSGLCRQALR